MFVWRDSGPYTSSSHNQWRDHIRDITEQYVTSNEDRAGDSDPIVVDGSTIDRLLKKVQGVGNKARLRFLELLAILHDGRLYVELGYSSYHQYCDRELGPARSTSYEYLRAAVALRGLPRLRGLFGEGRCPSSRFGTSCAWRRPPLNSPGSSWRWTCLCPCRSCGRKPERRSVRGATRRATGATGCPT